MCQEIYWQCQDALPSLENAMGELSRNTAGGCYQQVTQSRKSPCTREIFPFSTPSIIPRGKSFVWGSEKQLSHCPAQLLALGAWKQKAHVSTLVVSTWNHQLKSLLKVDLLCHTEAEGRYSLLGAGGIISMSHYTGWTTRAVAPSAGPVCWSSSPVQDGN